MVDVREQVRASRAVVGFVLVVLVLSGPLGVVDLVEPGNPQLGDGNATVAVLEPDDDQLRVTDGRFGTNVSYVRVPDLVVDVERLEGRPRIVYNVEVPALGLDPIDTQVVTAPGRTRLTIRDQALPDQPAQDRYRGYLDVRVQSTEGQTIVVNRTLQVIVE